jgi:hypothetical protein
MAERVNDGQPPRRRRYYPWSEWTDGSKWRAMEGKDYAVSAASFQTALHQRARLEGLTVDTGSPEKGIVEFQFHKSHCSDHSHPTGSCIDIIPSELSALQVSPSLPQPKDNT